MGRFRLFGLLALAATAPEAVAQYAFSIFDVPGSTLTTAVKINNNGDIVGNYQDNTGANKAYLLSGGVYTTITVPGAVALNAWGINDQRQVVGRWDDATGRFHGYVWDAGTVTVVDFPGATSTVTRGINNIGDIVGTYLDSNSVQHGFLLHAGVFNTFDYPGSTGTWATAINTAGDIVGDYKDDQGVTYGYLLRSGVFQAINLSSTATHANGINASGIIVGSYDGVNGAHVGFLYDGATFTTINVAGASGSNWANGINDAGVIVGRADLSNAGTHGFRSFFPKFEVVDDVSTSGGDFKYQYDASGIISAANGLPSILTSTRGLTFNAAGTRLWVLSANRYVFVFGSENGIFWQAQGINGSQPEGIAQFGNDIWILDGKSGKVFKYAGNAADNGPFNSTSSNFKLNAANTKPKDIVTNGTYFFVVDDAGTDKVYKYTMTGTFVSSFNLSTSGAAAPTGISIDPASPNDLWIVDSASKRVYKYANAVNAANNSNQSAASSFPLASGNTNPQGLAIKP